MPPPLLYAIDGLRKMHLAIARLEAAAEQTKYIHVDLVDALIANTVVVISEFVKPEWMPAALDKLHTLQAAAVPSGTNGATPGTTAAEAEPTRADETPFEPRDTMEPDE